MEPRPKRYFRVSYLFIFFNLEKAISSVQFSHSVVSNSLRPHGLQHSRPPCPSPTPGFYSNSHPLSQWCHTTISNSVIPFSSWLQSFPASWSFQMGQLFTWRIPFLSQRGWERKTKLCCNVAWPLFKLVHEKIWFLIYNTILKLDLYCQSIGTWMEVNPPTF